MKVHLNMITTARTLFPNKVHVHRLWVDMSFGGQYSIHYIPPCSLLKFLPVSYAKDIHPISTFSKVLTILSITQKSHLNITNPKKFQISSSKSFTLSTVGALSMSLPGAELPSYLWTCETRTRVICVQSPVVGQA